MGIGYNSDAALSTPSRYQCVYRCHSYYYYPYYYSYNVYRITVSYNQEVLTGTRDCINHVTVIVMGTGTRDGTGDTAVPWYTSPYAQCVLTGIAIQVIVTTILYQ